MSDIKFVKKIEDVLPEDYRFIQDKPDPNFSPARNIAIVKETIKETEKFFADLHKIDPEMQNRIDIVSSYGVRRLSGQTQKSFRDYVGKELFNQLIGEKIMAKVRIADTVAKLNKANGNNRFKQFILN